MAQFPSLPLWTDAYLADTSHLTDAEHGVYLQLLMLIWRSPECRVPNDDEWLARRFRRSADAVKETIRPIIQEFCKNDGNWITQGRLKDEWIYCKNKSKSQSARAKSRWDKEKNVCPADADTHDPGNAPIPTPIPTPNKNTSPNGFEIFWKEVEKKVGKAKTEKLYVKALKTTTHEKIMDGWAAYKANKPDWQEWIHPATWFGGKRWDDDYGSEKPWVPMSRKETDAMWERINAEQAAKDKGRNV